ncbi:MAG: ECF transporter S component, partial [Bacilli bacterium]|nr:ECF transporter S component [Bacilli bacterium]
MKLDHVQKITLSGILLALIIIFTRFLAIQYIPFLPFIRISIGPALIIFSSILLGPLYGGLLGGLSDLLGILLVPNPQGFMINPFIILLYTVLGIVPYFVFKLIKKVKSQKKLALSFYISLFVIWVFIFLFLMFNHEITLYEKVYP